MSHERFERELASREWSLQKERHELHARRPEAACVQVLQKVFCSPMEYSKTPVSR